MSYDYNYGAGSVDDSVIATIMGVLGGFILFILIIAVLMIIAKWRILSKGNKPGWAALIPFYGDVVTCQMVGVSPWWVLIACCASILNVIPVIGNLACFAAGLYYTILVNVSLARAFGKEDGYAVGLILLPVVFYPMLAFGKSEFKGQNPMKDIIFKNNNGTNSSTQPTNQDFTSNGSTDVKYCSSCGSKVETDTKYCPNCGSELN